MNSVISREKPEFFNSDREHYYIVVNDYIYNEIDQNKDFTDKNDSRSESRSKKDSMIGKISESAVKVFLEDEYNLNVEYSDDWKYDLKVNDKLIDVKCRDYKQTGYNYKDLLVRDRVDTEIGPDHVDYIIQAMINGSKTDKVYITGYCSGEFASNAEFFDKARTHRTRKVRHNDLNSIEKFAKLC